MHPHLMPVAASVTHMPEHLGRGIVAVVTGRRTTLWQPPDAYSVHAGLVF